MINLYIQQIFSYILTPKNSIIFFLLNNPKLSLKRALLTPLRDPTSTYQDTGNEAEQAKQLLVSVLFAVFHSSLPGQSRNQRQTLAGFSNGEWRMQ